MLSTTLFSVLLAGLASISITRAGGDFFVITSCPTISLSRIDPIVDPGRVSAHVHNICGGSGFGANLLSPDQQAGTLCSSAYVGDDKSNYWSPELYWQFGNGTYQPMIGNMRMYYYMKGPNVKPFPKGMHMITGTSMARDATAKKALGLRISCDGGQQGSELPTNCGAISLGIFFPSCGLADGSISSDDHFSHLTWPISFKGSEPYDDPNGETCPPTHPIKYPTIFYESNYYPTGGQVWGNGAKLVLANGDEWGPSFHADFHNGWDQAVLENTIKQCGGYGNGPTDRPENCAPLRPSVDKAKAAQCRLESQIPNEDVGLYRPIPALPGCNPSWPKGMDKKPGCAVAPPVPEMVYPNVYFRNLYHGSHIPAIFTGTNATDAPTLKYSYAPSLGDPGQSFWRPWGSDGTNKDKLRVSTVTDLLKGIVSGGTNAAPVDNSGNIASSAPVSDVSFPVASSTMVEDSTSSAAEASASSIVASPYPNESPAPSSDAASASSPVASPEPSTPARAPAPASAVESLYPSSDVASEVASEVASSTFSAANEAQSSVPANAQHALASVLSNSGSTAPAVPTSSPTASDLASDSASASASATAPASVSVLGSAISAVVSTADSAAAAFPTAAHAAQTAHKACRRKKRDRSHRRAAAGHLGRRSRRKALGM